ncbi:HARB1-like protein [Mya arenaria]|uniref:HARB1-like protein n=1 Tax=Mya arenaria TaxID=6604 RepID=A0ABY7E723_MYAAR|nr:HARB1-like protein [Mya arenaria]
MVKTFMLLIVSALFKERLELTYFRQSFLMDRIPNLDQLLESEIIDRYRFDWNGINFLEELLGAYIQPKAPRNKALSVKQNILITLRYLATGPIQLNDGDIHGVSQPTVSPILTEVIEVLSSPTLGIEECERNALQFRGIARFRKVIGAIDGAHIHVVSPHEQENIYMCPQHSVQVIFDGSYNIIDVVAPWPGSVHDSVIACCVLHNICKQRAIPMAAVAVNNDGGNGDDGRPQPQANNLVGLGYRDHFVSSYFGTLTA